MTISIREIARLSGVSSATVSRVLNGSSKVTEETTLRVRQVIRDLNFVPNQGAVHLKSGKSQIYGIVIPDVANPFFTEVVKLFEGLLFQNDYDLLVANTDFHSTRAQRSLHRMLLRRVDGVAILASEQEAAALAPLMQNRIPVVTTDHYRVGPGLSDIAVDFQGGMAKVADHLHALGHGHVGYIGGNPGPLTSRIRMESFLNSAIKLGMASREGWIEEGNYRIDGGAAAMARILSQPEIPTAVVAANDLMAIGALRAIYEKGLRIPQDISIVGCDDIEMSDIVYPPLTTLRISRVEYARMLFEALQKTEEDASQTGLQFALPTQLIVRKSTGPAPAR